MSFYEVARDGNQVSMSSEAFEALQSQVALLKKGMGLVVQSNSISNAKVICAQCLAGVDPSAPSQVPQAASEVGE